VWRDVHHIGAPTADHRFGRMRPGCFVFRTDPHHSDQLARSGFDWICLDQQHGRWDDETTLRALDVMGAVPAEVLVRVRSLDAGLIGRALDAGADGVIVPMIESAEQAAEAVSAVRYAPLGRRSYGPIRSAYGVTESVESANSRVRLAVMIETDEALAQLDAIARVPGIDLLFVGPFDLSITLGWSVDQLLAQDDADAPLVRIAAAACSAGIGVGAFAGTPERAARLAQLGFVDLAITSDTAALSEGAAAQLSRVAASLPG